jgi:hypothetical protein
LSKDRGAAAAPGLRRLSPGTLALACFAVALTATALGLSTPWLPLDEAGVVQAARDLGEGPARAGLLYPLLLWIPAHVLSAGALLAVGKVLAAVAWAALAVPAYVLARTVASPRLAGAATVVVVAGPGAVYGTTVLPDALATLLGVCSLAAAARGSRRTAVALALGAALARPWLLPLAPAVALALATPHERGRLWRWPGAAALAFVAPALYLAYAATGAESFAAVLRGGLGSLALVTLACGVVPWVLAWAVRPGPDVDPLRTLLLGVTVAAAVGAGFASAGSSGGRVDERAALILLPLLCALAAAALEHGVDRGALPFAAVSAPLLVVSLPWPLSEEGGTLAAALFRHLGSSHLVLIVVVTLLATLPLVPASRALGAALAVAVACVGANAAAAWNDAADLSREVRRLVSPPRSTIDAAVGADADVLWAVRNDEGSAQGIAATQLWNRSLRRVVRVDPDTADPQTGVLSPQSAEFVLVSGLAGAIGGQAVARTQYGTILRVNGPPRVTEAISGRYSDGWSGGETTYRRFFGPPSESTLTVTASRSGWTGPDKPARVVVDVATSSGVPFSERVVEIHSKETHTLVVPVPPPPFTAIVRIAPTFSPAEFGGSDPRQLGAVLTFAYLG